MNNSMKRLNWAAPRRYVIVVAGVVSSFVATSVAAGQAPPPPVPRIDTAGPSLRFDFPDMRVGIAEYEEGPTGTTVFYFPKGVKGAVDVRGGAPGTVNAAALMNSYESKMMEAVVFSGGSWYGLSAATGVANGIKELHAADGNVDFIAGVVAAIIYDVGGRRYSRITPDDRLGQAAVRAARPGWFPLGARGAGRFAMQGVYYLRGQGADKYADWSHSGQGAAFRTIGQTKIRVFTVVNALGTIVDRNGRVVRCSRNQSAGACPLISEKLKAFTPISRGADTTSQGPTANTTLTLVVTNQKMPFWALQRLAVQVHGSMNRAIQPFATVEDGDVLYAVTTDEVENPSLSYADLGVVASELAWDAVLSSTPEIPPSPQPLATQPTIDVLRKYAGVYEFYGGTTLTVRVEGTSLVAEAEGNGRIYFDAKRKYRLAAAPDNQFIIESPARDILRFEDAGNQIVGVTLNPGPWLIRATRRR
jgi:L-aminopeptidase/D-esterase-like protein